MKEDLILKKLVDYLNNYGLKVEFLKSATDDISIAKLSQHKIVLNSSSRDTIGIICTIAHLFGHYIQFQNFDKYKHLIYKVKEEPKPLILSKKFKQEFIEYEKEAFQIGKYLLLQVTAVDTELERKYQIFYETDFDIFWEFLTQEQKTKPLDFNKEFKRRIKTDTKERTPFTPIKFPKGPVDLHNIFLVVY